MVTSRCPERNRRGQKFAQQEFTIELLIEGSSCNPTVKRTPNEQKVVGLNTAGSSAPLFLLFPNSFNGGVSLRQYSLLNQVPQGGASHS